MFVLPGEITGLGTSGLIYANLSIDRRRVNLARIQVSVERLFQARVDHVAQREHISRSKLIARGLRLALAS
jgi:hypothetical protein